MMISTGRVSSGQEPSTLVNAMLLALTGLPEVEDVC